MKNSNIEWADPINNKATGRQLGAYKSAAKKSGCSLEDWMLNRSFGRARCYRCKTWKLTSAFTIDLSRKSGKTSICKSCMSEASTASRYKISRSKLKEFREKHGNLCAICSSTQILYIDHNHKTGELRGLLCPRCNSAIGLFAEDPHRLSAAINYLGKYNG